MFWSGKPVDNPNVEIECGGNILTLPKIEAVMLNPNFPKTAHYFDVVSTTPQYRPYIHPHLPSYLPQYRLIIE